MNNYNQIKFLVTIFIIIIILAFLAKIFLREKYPYEKVESIVTPTEKKFLIALLSVVDANTYVFSKVRLADIVNVKKGTGKYLKYFSKIQSKHIDFLLCNSVDFSPLLAIELDDSSHLTESAAERDEVKNRILKAADVPILRIKPQKRYDLDALKNSIDQNMYR